MESSFRNVAKKELSNSEDENELEPQILEKVMAKVVDIEKPGIGYSMVRSYPKDNESEIENSEFLRSIFECGLLGKELGDKGGKYHGESDKEQWAHNVRKDRNAVVYFNLTGTGRQEGDPKRNEIEQSYWVSGNSRISLLFDISSFKQEDPLDKEEYKNFKQKNKRYRLDYSGSGSVEDYKERGKVDTEHGFVLSHRIAPRNFMGIMVKLWLPSNTEEIERFIAEKKKDWPRIFTNLTPEELKNYEAYLRSDLSKHGKEDTDANHLIKEAKRIAKVMMEVYQGKEELIIPIYDVKGNMLWPKYMAYSEIKALEQD